MRRAAGQTWMGLVFLRLLVLLTREHLVWFGFCQKQTLGDWRFGLGACAALCKGPEFGS